jgi:hypothetical protein
MYAVEDSIQGYHSMGVLLGANKTETLERSQEASWKKWGLS